MREDLTVNEPVDQRLPLAWLTEEKRRKNLGLRQQLPGRKYEARSRTCQGHITRRPRVASAVESGVEEAMRLQHFMLEGLPDRRVQFDKAWMQAYLLDIPRPRQIDVEFGDRMARGTRRQHYNTIGERDRFLEVMRDEKNSADTCDQRFEQFVFHELASLHIESAERLIHQEQLGSRIKV